MIIFITGGAGFIGCNLADYHLRHGDHVVIFDNLSRRGTDSNLAWLKDNHVEHVSFMRGDIRDFEALRAALPQTGGVMSQRRLMPALVAVTLGFTSLLAVSSSSAVRTKTTCEIRLPLGPLLVKGGALTLRPR